MKYFSPRPRYTLFRDLLASEGVLKATWPLVKPGLSQSGWLSPRGAAGFLKPLVSPSQGISELSA